MKPKLLRGAPALAYVALAVADATLAGKEGTTSRRLRFLTKPALMPTLAVAMHQATPGDPLVRRGVSTAQAFSWGGDVALLGTSEKAFLGGVGSFLAAHLAYIATFTARRDRAGLAQHRGPRTAAALWLATAPVMSAAAWRKDRDLAAPVAVYSTALATMFATATVLDPALSRRGRRAVAAGAALFLTSDTLLATQKFLLPADNPSARGSGDGDVHRRSGAHRRGRIVPLSPSIGVVATPSGRRTWSPGTAMASVSMATARPARRPPWPGSIEATCKDGSGHVTRPRTRNRHGSKLVESEVVRAGDLDDLPAQALVDDCLEHHLGYVADSDEVDRVLTATEHERAPQPAGGVAEDLEMQLRERGRPDDGPRHARCPEGRLSGRLHPEERDGMIRAGVEDRGEHHVGTGSLGRVDQVPVAVAVDGGRTHPARSRQALHG